jgi:hypothetical protein
LLEGSRKAPTRQPGKSRKGQNNLPWFLLKTSRYCLHSLQVFGITFEVFDFSFKVFAHSFKGFAYSLKLFPGILKVFAFSFAISACGSVL